MLINKLKQYPRISQRSYSGGSSNTTSQNPNASGNFLTGADQGISTLQNYPTGNAIAGEYITEVDSPIGPAGTEFIGPYHIMPDGTIMTGYTHGSGVNLVPAGTVLIGRPNTNTPATSNAIQPQLYIPSSAELAEYEKYRVSGSLYKSNISYVNSRDNKGNITLRENENNELLLIENISDNFTNRSIVSAIDTQFKYFKFPAQISTTIDDITFDESLLDIDLDLAVSNDPYSGKLIKSSAGGQLYYVQAGKKRKFFIVADSTWALKNGLPPFANIAGTINGKDNGEDNYFSQDTAGINTGYNNETVITVPASVFDGYEIGDDYTPEDAFLEGSVYGKISFKTSVNDNLGTINDTLPAGKFLNINGPHFGFISFNGIRETIEELRFAEFSVNEIAKSTSYIGISVSNFDNYTSDLINYNIIADNDPFGPYRSNYSSGGFNNTAGSIVDLLINGNNTITKIGERLKFDTTGQSAAPQEYIDLNSTYMQRSVTGGSFTTGKIDTISSVLNNPLSDFRGINGESLYNSNNETKYIWYKVTIPINRQGTRYQLFHNGNSIGNLLRDRDGNQSGFSSVDLLAPNANNDPYKGWVLRLEDIYPNGFQPNTADQFEIKFLNDQSTTFDLDIYFIGWRQQDTAGTIQKYYVVQSSIYFQLPDLNTPTMIGGPNDI